MLFQLLSMLPKVIVIAVHVPAPELGAPGGPIAAPMWPANDGSADYVTTGSLGERAGS